MSFQVGGLVSGMDTNALIDQLMTLERQPEVVMQQTKHIYELRKDLWNEINTSLLALKTKNDDLLQSNALQQKTAVSSNTSTLTASASTTAAAGNYSISISQLATNHRVFGSTMASTWTAAASGAFTIGDGTFTAAVNVNAGDSLATIAQNINNAKDASGNKIQVTASVVNNTLVLQHQLTGSANFIHAQDTTGNTLQTLGILTSAAADSFNPANTQNPQDAVLTVNGVSVTRSSNQNLTDVITGVTLNLSGTTAAGSSVSLSVKTDTDTIVGKIKAFVDQYNSVMDLINTRLSEDPVKGATTDVGMSKGLLRGNTVLVGLKDDLRRIMSDPIAGLGGTYSQLSQIGITTDSTDFGKSGKLVIDETKLRQALDTNPSSVQKLFFNDTNANGIVDQGELGVAAQIYSKLSSLTDSSTVSYGTTVVKKGIIPQQIDSYGQIIDSYTQQIDDFESRMSLREQALRQQFLAMEQSLLVLQGQSTAISQRLGQFQS